MSVLPKIALGFLLRGRICNALESASIFRAAAQVVVPRGLTGILPLRSGLRVYPKVGAFTSTPGLQYRADGTAPLGVIVPFLGKADGTGGDVIAAGVGSQVIGYWYDGACSYQGSMAVLFKVPWVGTDGRSHCIVYGPNVLILKTAANVLNIYLTSPTGVTISLSTPSGWALGSQHLIVVRWDCDNPVSGAAYVDAWVDGVQSTGQTTPLTPIAVGTWALGSYSGTAAFGGPGIKYVLQTIGVMPDATVAALWGGGTPVSPDRAMSKLENVAFFWSPGARAASGNFTGSLVDEACGQNWRPYHATNNPYGNLLASGIFETDADVAAWTGDGATLSRTTTAADLAGFGGVGALKITTTVAGSGGVAYKDITGLTAGDTLYVVGDGKTNDFVVIYSGTAADPTNTTVIPTTPIVTGTRFSAVVRVAAGHDQIRIRMGIVGPIMGATTVLDNWGVWKSLAVNGGFEGVFAKTGTALTTSTAATSAVTDLGGGSYRVTDSTAWDLSLAVVGMIAEWHDGSGFITTVTDASDLIEFNGITGNPPTTGDAVAVYSAIAPGWTALGAARFYRAAGRFGYAQGVVNSVNSGAAATQSVATVGGEWITRFCYARVVSGTGQAALSSGGHGNLAVTTSPTFALISAITRPASTPQILYLHSTDAATVCEFEDVVATRLGSFTLTATPASDANSREVDGYRMDGGDVNSIPNNGLIAVGDGTITLRVRPRGWAGGNSTTRYLLDATSGAGRVEIWHDATNILAFRLTDNAAGVKQIAGTVNATSLPAETVAVITARWSGGTLQLMLNGTALTTSSGAGTGVLGTAPTTLYFGSTNAGASQGDIDILAAAFSRYAITDAEEARLRALLGS